MTIRPRLPRLTALLVSSIALLAFVGGSWGVRTAHADPPGSASQVVVSTDVSEIELEAFPCWRVLVTVHLENTGDEPVYADAWIEPTGPVQVSRELVSTYLPAGYRADATVSMWIPADTPAGSWTISVHNDNTASTITATSQGVETGGNLIRTSTVSASTAHVGMPACNTADGNTDSTNFQRTAWFDASARVFPDWIAYDFAEPTSVSRVELYMLDSEKYPAARFALSSYDVQARVNGEWTTIASVRDNVEGHVVTEFPPVFTDGLRIMCLGANDDFYSRIVEAEAYA